MIQVTSYIFVSLSDIQIFNNHIQCTFQHTVCICACRHATTAMYWSFRCLKITLHDFNLISNINDSHAETGLVYDTLAADQPQYPLGPKFFP